MNQNAKQNILSILLIILGLFGVFFLSGFLEKNVPAEPESYADEDLVLQGAKIKGYALGFEGLLADWYWMKSLQYIGDKVVKSNKEISMENLNELNPRLLYPYLDNATTLDPKFTAAYEYGAIVLPSIDIQQAIELTEKGIKNNPNDWHLYNSLGYIYWRTKDFEKAAEAYERGAAIADAPPYMRLMAARTKSDGGSRDVAREIYNQMFEQATDINIKNNAKVHLQELDALDERDLIRQALKNFQAKNNRCITNWREIIGEIQKIAPNNSLRFDKISFAPLDPTDVPYLLVTENSQCSVDIDRLNTKLSLSE